MDVGLFFCTGYAITFFAVAGAMALVVYPSAWDIAVLFERRNKNTLRLGGIAVAAGFLLPCISAGYFGNERFNAVIAGGAVILIGGLINDAFWGGKKAVDIVFAFAAAVISFLLGNRLDQITVGGGQVQLGMLSFPITVFILMTVVLAFGVIEEHSAGIGVICLSTLLIISFAHRDVAVIGETSALLGSATGSLIYKSKSKKLFPGLSGEQLIGFIISSFSLEMLSSDGQIWLTAWFPAVMTVIAGLLFFYEKITYCRNDTTCKIADNVGK